MSSVWKVSGRKWRAQYTAPDGSRPSRTFARRADALEWLADMEGAVRSGDWVAPSDMTLGEWLDEFVAVYRTNIAQATRQSYNYTLQRLERYAPDLVSLKVQDIGQPAVQRALNALRKNLHSRTVEITRTLLNMAMKKAVELNMIQKNPVTGTTIQKSDRQHGGKYIPSQDLADLIEKLRSKPGPVNDMLVLIAHTGLRTQEARALRAEDIRDGGIHVRAALDPAGNRKATKTEASVRFVPVSGWLMDMLLERSRTSLNGLLFCNYKGHALGKGSALSALRRLTAGQYSPHDLRHTFVTNAIRNGVNLRALADITGDRVETLLSVYTHVTDDDRRRAVELAIRPVEDNILRFKAN